MRNELEDQLFKKYPEMLVDLAYIETGDGWFTMLGNMLEELKHFNPKFKQIKEKFGSLRAYYTCQTKFTAEVDTIISKYEDVSLVTCEICGQAGKRQSCHGWLSVVCDDHYKEWEAKSVK